MASEKQIKLQFAPVVGLQSIFADQAVLQSAGDTFLLTFYQVEPPLAASTNVDKLESLTAYPVARVAVAADLLEKLGRMFTNAASQRHNEPEGAP